MHPRQGQKMFPYIDYGDGTIGDKPRKESTVRDLEPNTAVGCGVSCRERRYSLLDGGKDGIKIAARFCNALCLEVGSRVFYARTRTCTREGWELCITLGLAFLPIPGFVFPLAICASFLGLLIARGTCRRRNPSTKKKNAPLPTRKWLYVLCVSFLPNTAWPNRAYTDKQTLLWSAPMLFQKSTLIPPKSSSRKGPHRIPNFHVDMVFSPKMPLAT